MAKSTTAHLQTPAVKKKRAAAIRAAFARKRAAGGAEPVPVIAYEGEKRPSKKARDARIELAADFVAVVAALLEVR